MELLRLASLTCLQPLSLRELASIAPCAAERSIPAGGRVLFAGPLHQELVLVATGRAVVRCAGETIAQLGPGEAFGSLAPARTTYTTATVTALTRLRLVTFSTREIEHLRRMAPEALAALLVACSAAPASDRRPAPPYAAAAAAAA